MTTGQGNRGKPPGPATTPRKARSTAKARAITDDDVPEISEEEFQARMAYAMLVLQAEEQGLPIPKSPFGKPGTYRKKGNVQINKGEEGKGGGFLSETVGKPDPKRLVGLEYLQSIVLDQTADPTLRAQAAQKLTTFERHALEVIDDKQLYRQPRTAIQQAIAEVRAKLSGQGLVS